MKKTAVMCSVLIVGALLLTSCGIPAEVQKQISDLQDENKQWKETDRPALEKRLADLQTQLDAKSATMDKQVADLQAQAAKVPALDKQISDLQAQLAKYPNVINVTYGEVTTFMKNDDTDKKGPTSTPGTIVLAQNAWKAGIYSHFVGVFLAASNQWASLVGFNTTDKGWVYFSANSDTERFAEVGKKFSELNRLTSPGFDDTIQSISIFP